MLFLESIGTIIITSFVRNDNFTKLCIRTNAIFLQFVNTVKDHHNTDPHYLEWKFNISKILNLRNSNLYTFRMPIINNYKFKWLIALIKAEI